MVLTKNISSSDSEPGLGCLICSKRIVGAKPLKYKPETLRPLFETLCRYMARPLPPPKQYQFSFDNDPFPCCMDCTSGLESLHEFHQCLEEVQKQIDQITARLSGKILLFGKDECSRERHGKAKVDYRNENGLHASESTQLNFAEKVRYYRNLVYKRYSTTVLLSADPKWTQAVLDKSRSDDVIETPEGNDDIGMEMDSLELHDFHESAQSFESNVIVKLEKGSNNAYEADDGRETGTLSTASSENVVLNRFRRRKNDKISGGETVVALSEIDETCFSSEEVEKIENRDPDFDPSIEVKSENTSDEEESLNLKNSEDVDVEDREFGDDMFTGIEATDSGNPFPRLGSRVKKVKENEFTLDENYRFAFINNKWSCITCDLCFRKKSRLKEHFFDCPGEPGADIEEALKFKRFTYDKLGTGKFRCRHCKYVCPSDTETVCHIRKYHIGKLGARYGTKPSLTVLKRDKYYLCYQKFLIEFADGKFRCWTCSAEFSKRSETLSHIGRQHLVPLPVSTSEPTEHVKFTKVSSGKFMADGKFSFEKVDSGFKCCECMYTSPSWYTMRNHMKYKHVNKDRYVCATCGMKFGAKKFLLRHEKTHKSDRPFVCELCGKSCKLEGGLVSHKALFHPETLEKKFTCEQCGHNFPTPGQLNSHVKTHEVVVCHICGRKMLKASLRAHVATHTGEPFGNTRKTSKAYECDKCGEIFSYSKSLMLHQNKHEGIKPYSCSICGMKFTQTQSMKRHQNAVHASQIDNTVRYTCDICGKEFTQSFSVIRHKNSVHKGGKKAKSQKSETADVSHKEEQEEPEESEEDTASEGEEQEHEGVAD